MSDAEIARLKGALQAAAETAVAKDQECRRLTAEIKRLRAATQWRPIESAPKDGRQFLVWDIHYGVRIGRAHIRADHDDWLSYMDAHKGSSKGGIRATHWLPLPPPPAMNQEGGE